MPSTLAQFRTRIQNLLMTSGVTEWSSTDYFDEALRLALDEYSDVCPYTIETVITLPGTGREIALNNLSDLRTVTDVWWPYSSTAAEVFPPNRVKGYKVFWDDARPVLYIDVKDGGQPKINDELRIWYTKNHTVQNLDSASITSIYPGHESHLVIGAAGWAAIMRGRDRSKGFEQGQGSGYLKFWGADRQREFRGWLALIRIQPGRGLGDTFGAGWPVDSWDEQK